MFTSQWGATARSNRPRQYEVQPNNNCYYEDLFLGQDVFFIYYHYHYFSLDSHIWRPTSPTCNTIKFLTYADLSHNCKGFSPFSTRKLSKIARQDFVFCVKIIEILSGWTPRQQLLAWLILFTIYANNGLFSTARHRHRPDCWSRGGREIFLQSQAP